MPINTLDEVIWTKRLLEKSSGSETFGCEEYEEWTSGEPTDGASIVVVDCEVLERSV